MTIRRAIARAIGLVFLITSPIILPSLIIGIWNGIAFTLWRDDHVKTNIEHFVSEVDDLVRWDAFSIPGIESFGSFLDKDTAYHIPQLRTANWAAKLNCHMPKEHYVLGDDPDVPIDKSASLEGLMLDVSCGGPEAAPREMWIYLTGFNWKSQDDFLWPWDKAFDRALQRAYTRDEKARNATQFFSLACHSSQFLCGVWYVESPTLLHLKVAETAPTVDDMEPGFTYNADLKNLRAIEVRVIEFPLAPDVYTGLPSHVFPSMDMQVQAMIEGDRLWEQFEPYDELKQILCRFNDRVRRARRAKGTVYHYLEQIDDWHQDHVTEPLGLEDAVQDFHFFVFNYTLLAAIMVLWPFRLINDLWGSFTGAPHPARWGAMQEEPENIWEGLFGDAMLNALERAGQEAKKGGKATDTAAWDAPQSAWDAAQKSNVAPYNMEEILESIRKIEEKHASTSPTAPMADSISVSERMPG